MRSWWALGGACCGVHAFFFSSRRRHTRFKCDWSSDVCSSDLYFEGKPLADAIDPTGPADGDPNNHVVRAGAYSANAAVAGNCRAAIRRPTEVLTKIGRASCRERV